MTKPSLNLTTKVTVLVGVLIGVYWVIIGISAGAPWPVFAVLMAITAAATAIALAWGNWLRSQLLRRRRKR